MRSTSLMNFLSRLRESSVKGDSPRFSRRSGLLRISAIAGCVMLASLSVARADYDAADQSISNGGFGPSAGTINQGQSVNWNLGINLANPSESGGAGTTTHTFNANTATINTPGAAAASGNSSVGGGGSSQSFAITSTYYAPGSYTANVSQSFSAHATENSSYGLGQGNFDANIGFSATSSALTVLNVAPTATDLSFGPGGGVHTKTINQGQTASAFMTATDPGNDTLTFTVNGSGAGAIGGAPGSTRTSNTVTTAAQLVPGVFNINGSVTDGNGGSANAAAIQLTVLNVAPTLVSITPNSTTPAGQPFNFSASATDPGGPSDPLTYNWSIDGNPYAVGASQSTPANYFLPNTTHTISVVVNDSFGGSTSGQFILTVVPEPSSFVLAAMGIGMAGFGWYRRRRRSA